MSGSSSSQPKKKNRKGCVIALIGIGLLIVCGLVVVGGIFLLPELIPSLEPTPPVVVTPYDDGSTPSGAEAPLDVVNNSDYTICYLYISPSTSDDWGEDWLWDIGTIEPGFASIFYLPVGETFDMRTEDCDGELLDEQYNVTVPPEGLTYTLTP